MMSKHFLPGGETDPDPYFKKYIEYQYRDRTLIFRVSQELFSSQDIDVGTKHLLKTLTDKG
jgi:16S rRNA G1207 methylase RsmC